VIFDELKEWDLSHNVKKNSVRVMFEDQAGESETPVQIDTSRPQRPRVMPARLQDCDVIVDDQVNDEGELVHYAFLTDTEPVSMTEALNNPKWISAMIEEPNSIENNDTWSLVNLPHDKKAIDVKWVFKVKVNSQGEVTRHKANL
jgi:hypothetical protein